MFFKKKIKQEEPANFNHHESSVSEWLENDGEESEGQLAIDVFQTAKQIIIKSTIAGVEPENLKISLHHDLLTIKGRRNSGRMVEGSEYIYQECYWGSFSRSIILPAEVDQKKIEADLENGILTIILQKKEEQEKGVEIKIKD
jgi:HSP20 family protein